MRQTWAYVVMAVGTLLGIGALLLPLPETFQVEVAEAPVVSKKVEGKRPAPQSKAKKGPAKGPHKAPPPPVAKKFPTKDTVKGRITPTKK